MSTKRKTIEEIKKEVNTKYKGKITVLSNIYKNNKTPLRVVCNDCKDERNVSFNKLMTDSLCPTCSGKKRYSKKEIEERLSKLVGNEYTLIKYSGKINGNATIRHNKCKEEFTPNLNAFLNKGTRCPYCSTYRNTKKSHNEFNKEFIEKFPLFSVVSLYDGNSKSIKVKCNRCSSISEKIPNWIFNNNSLSCEFCDNSRKSDGIRKILAYLTTCNIKYRLEVHFKNLLGEAGKKLRYDIFIPEKGLLIEFDGSQHFIPTKRYTKEKLEKRRRYDILKDNKILSSRKYSLLRISWKEYDSIDSILESIFNSSSTTIRKYNLLFISKNSEKNYNLEGYYTSRSTP